MTSPAKTARPPKAAIAWATKDAIFLEIPGPTAPYIARYRRTVEGLAAALNILIEHSDPLPRNAAQSSPDVKRIPQPRVPNATADQRAKAAEVVKRLFK